MRAETPHDGLDDLAGARVAVVRRTAASELFVRHELMKSGEATRTAATILSLESDEAVLLAVMRQQVDAGAVHVRHLVDFMEREQPSLRVLARSPPMPALTVVLRAELTEALAPAVGQALQAMTGEPDGRRALAAFEITELHACGHEDHAAVRQMLQHLAGHWDPLGGQSSSLASTDGDGRE